MPAQELVKKCDLISKSKTRCCGPAFQSLAVVASPDGHAVPAAWPISGPFAVTTGTAPFHGEAPPINTGVFSGTVS